MKKMIIVVAAVVIVGLAGAFLLLRSGSSVNSPSSAVQNPNIPPTSTSASAINPGYTLPGGTLPSKKTATQSSLPPSPPSAGADQTSSKKQAATLINQSNTSAGEFNTMENSASQMDQNTSL